MEFRALVTDSFAAGLGESFTKCFEVSSRFWNSLAEETDDNPAQVLTVGRDVEEDSAGDLL